MKKLLGLLGRLWGREPVLVGSIVPLLVTVGVVSQQQASAVTNAITGVAAVVGELAVAFGVRSRVSPVTKTQPVPPTAAPAASSTAPEGKAGS